MLTATEERLIKKNIRNFYQIISCNAHLFGEPFIINDYLYYFDGSVVQLISPRIVGEVDSKSINEIILEIIKRHNPENIIFWGETPSLKFDNMGLEGIYHKDKLVWGMSYTGIYSGITEEEADNILRPALLDNPETRGWKKVEKDYDGYKYTCVPDWEDANIENMAGIERIFRGEKEIYTFYYGGSLLI